MFRIEYDSEALGDLEAEATKITSNSSLMAVINKRSDETYTHDEVLRELGLENTKP